MDPHSVEIIFKYKNLGKVQKPVLMKLPMQWELSIQAKV